MAPSEYSWPRVSTRARVRWTAAASGRQFFGESYFFGAVRAVASEAPLFSEEVAKTPRAAARAAPIRAVETLSGIR